MSNGADDHLLALVDELPSLFADDEEAQLLMLNDGHAPHAEPPLSRAAHGSELDVGSPASPAPPSLSAEEIAELLRDIGSPSDTDERSHSTGPPYQLQSHEEQQRVLVAKQQQSISRQVNRKKSKGAPHKSNKARDGRKTEILLLRKTVFELENRLDGLKKQTKANDNSQELSNYYTGGYNRRHAPRLLLAQHDDPDAELQSAWQEIARCQFDQRDASERENVRLRLVLESQLKVAKSLEKFLLLKAASTMVRRFKCYTLQPNNVLTLMVCNVFL